MHLATSGVSSKTINATITALRFFFEVTLDDHQIMHKMSTVHEPRKLPVILDPDEVKRLLEAATTLKYRAALADSCRICVIPCFGRKLLKAASQPGIICSPKF